MTDDFMQALFIGQTYIDVTFITDHMPIGDEKHVAKAYAVSFGGNAVTAAFCCAKLGIVPDLIATVANDWLGRIDRKSTRLNSSHLVISYAVFCLKKIRQNRNS